MFGFPDDALGHLTSSGTIANLESLWVARELHPGKAIAFSTDAHYTHSRMCAVLGVEGIATDDFEAAARSGKVGTIVVTAGTTGLGTVDAVAARRRAARALRRPDHVDAAYGGFFALLDELVPVRVLPRDRACRQRRRRPAQARPAALRVRRRAVPRPRRRAPLQARLALHLLHVRRPPPRRDLARVLARGRLRGRAVADAALARPEADPGGRRPRRPRLGRHCCAESDVLRLHVDPVLDIVSYFPARPRASEIDAASARVLDGGDDRRGPGVPEHAADRRRGLRRRAPRRRARHRRRPRPAQRVDEARARTARALAPQRVTVEVSRP